MFWSDLHAIIEVVNSDDLDIAFDFQHDTPSGKDPDSDSERLRRTHQFLWVKPLPSGEQFTLEIPARRGDGYLIHRGPAGALMWLGSDAITNSYTRWTRPAVLKTAIESLSVEQRKKYLDPPYTVASAMIWPVRSADRPTINQARGTRTRIADRIDLTLECIRRHYEGERDSPLGDVLAAYGDFFRMFESFQKFVDFFHFGDLVDLDGSLKFFLPFEDFERHAAPKNLEEYIEYSEAVLAFIDSRGRRISDWAMSGTPH